MASPVEEAAAEVDGEGGGSEAAEAFQQAMLQQMRRELRRELRQHEQAVQERLRQLDERLRALEERVGETSASGEHAASGRGLPVTVGEVAQEACAIAITEAEGDDGQAQQEPVSPGVAERLSKLEAAMATALHTMFPRVEALLSQLERDSVGRACDGEDVADPAPAPAPAAPAVAVCDPAAQLLGCQLLEAMQDGTAERVRELLDAGADPNFRRGDGWTPLMVGARYNRNQALLLLLDRGADPRARDCLGTCALHLAVCEERTGRTVRLLVGGGADPNCADHSGQTPLHFAARWGSVPAARALLAAGARVDAVDAHGRTPRHIAWTQEVRRLFDGPRRRAAARAARAIGTLGVSWDLGAGTGS